PAILMDYGALAKFDMQSGIISAYGAESGLELKLGTALIRGGRIDTDRGCAVRSDGNLILTGTPKIVGGEIDVITTRPISLSYGETAFSGGLTVKYGREFSRGKITRVLNSATADSMKHVRLYDANGDQMPLRFFNTHSLESEKNFGAVYLPYFVDFHGTDGVIFRREILHGERAISEIPPERVGYAFIGWRLQGGAELYDFETEIVSDLDLYSHYQLLAPTFTLSPLEFIFDGEERKIEISDLTHPLLDGANLTYSWLRDDVQLNSAFSSLPIKYVSDSGSYRCQITLTVGTDSVTVTSDPISVTVNRATVPIPTVADKEYNGDYQFPDLPTSVKYVASLPASRAAGVYFVTLTLTDAENYEFSDGGTTATVAFEIKPRQITVRLSDSHKYLFSSPTTPTFSLIDGEVLIGDELNITFIFEGDKVLCKNENPNYLLTVIEGRIVKHATLGERDLYVAFVALLVIIVLALLILVLVWRRREIRHYFSILKYKLTPVSHFEAENTVKTPQELTAAPEIRTDASGMSIEPERADGLISNSMAKSLLRRGREVIESDGNKKRVINVGTLNAEFCVGDTVDVNKLKSANLVPYDTAYIKVLAGGVIDKPLKVYANDFSLCAVKMLALAGGEAVRVVTLPKKSEHRARKKKNSKKT
ncbi:MAG: uL15 family ribosomal protein, partial [Clostridia bacterium]|nr:uL15 family ribosomal protein [Clostridia bacterium]